MAQQNPLDTVPPSKEIRTYIAKNIREGYRLKSLLRLSLQIEGDREFITKCELSDVTTRQERHQ